MSDRTKDADGKDKPVINIGTAGHIDHGKTTLSAVLTRIGGNAKSYSEIDNAPEEKERGITIKSSCMEYFTDKRRVTHHDCPGHADFIKNFITSISQLDAIILVIAATDGMMPQTKEHLLLARQLGITNIIIFINKVDALLQKKDGEEYEDPEETLAFIEMEVQEDCEKLGFTVHSIIRGSALCALEPDSSNAISDAAKRKELGTDAVQKLFNAIDELPLPPTKEDQPFSMNIEGVYSIQGRGTVIAGRIQTGKIKIGDLINIIGLEKEKQNLTITGIEMFHKSFNEAKSGDNVGILVRGLDHSAVTRGTTAVKADSKLEAKKRFKAKLLCLTTEDGGRSTPFTNTFTPQLHIGTADVTAKKLEFPSDVKIVNPGEHIELVIETQYPIYLYTGLKFSIRESNKTIASGSVTEVL